MRTIIDNQGCNTTLGSVGLTVQGDLNVNGVDILNQLNYLVGLTGNLQSQPKGDTVSAAEVNDLSQRLGNLKKLFQNALEPLTTKVDDLKKELKSSQEENKKLVERVKTLETESKKSAKSAKKESETTES